MPGALDGIRVLDLTRLLPGAVATQWLAEFGAEVIKIEQPGIGDYARESYAALFEQTNSGKKSVEIDLKSERKSFMGLAASADVVIDGFRPGVMERLGLGYEILRETNPRLIYVALTGYGKDGPHAALAGHDVNYLAMSGVLDLIRSQDGVPVIPGVQIADLAGGSMQAVIGILLAIEARHRTGCGQRVDVSMTDGCSALLPVARSQGPVELLRGHYACYHVYAAANDSFVAVGALEEKFWSNLCRELGREDLIALQFAPNQAPVIEALEEIFGAVSADEWFEQIGAKDCCVTPVLRAKDSTRTSIPRLSETRGRDLARAPRLGEHNRELLRINKTRLAPDTRRLDPVTAGRFARLALDCVAREYPNKVAHTMQSDRDVLPPRVLTPAFYGCYDWHSAVHGHWLLARLARLFPDAEFAAAARAALAKNITEENIAAEVRYFNDEGRAAFERPYGLAWLLTLAAEMRSEVLRPLENAVLARFSGWLEKLPYPVRSGEHSNTAFALGLALDSHRCALFERRARDFYANDRDAPLAYEPSGEDFLSPSLAAADVMRRVLPPTELEEWLAKFLPDPSRLRPVASPDPSDPKFSHLDGLNLSRAWMLRGIGRQYEALADLHAEAGLAAVTGEHYEGAHWLATFAVYLLTSG